MLDTDLQIPLLFEQQVRECLSRLYDYAFLQDHPLIQALVPHHILPAQRVQVFRQTVLDAIEKFRPQVRMDFHSRQARTYNILLLRYVEGHESQDVVQQLAFSERQFYREHRRALQALSRILWEQAHQFNDSVRDGSVDDDSVIDDSIIDDSVIPLISVQSEVQRAFGHLETTHVDVGALLQGIITATQSLAERLDIDIELVQSDGFQLAKL